MSHEWDNYSELFEWDDYKNHEQSILLKQRPIAINLIIMDLMHRMAIRLFYNRNEGALLKLILSLLWLLSVFYGLVVRLRLLLYKKNLLSSRSIPARVLCVGNITVGGTGKTPLVMTIARFLAEKGKKVGIVSRGYSRKTHGSFIVSSGEGALLGVEEAGDEAFLMAQKLSGIPVAVGEDRHSACSLLLKYQALDAIILDDGFSHLSLKRNLDILMFKAGRGIGNGHLLPRGPLREPLKGIKRASACVIVGRDIELQSFINRLNPHARIFEAQYRLTGFRSARDGQLMSLMEMRKAKLFAFCGIADPDSFFSTLMAENLNICGKVAYPDHYWYTEEDLNNMSLMKENARADFAVTTEKDYARFARRIPLERLPLLVAECDLSVEESFKDFILSCMKG